MKRHSSPRASAAGQLQERSFPNLALPFRIPFPPMEATKSDQLPPGDDWQFEPKWDGFRCLVFRKEQDIVMQSKAGQSLSRYFPELLAAFLALPYHSFVLDGEIVIFDKGRLSFDDLLQRIHPAESRILKLSKERPAVFIAFDLLYDPVDGGELLLNLPLQKRRLRLQRFFEKIAGDSLLRLTPVTMDRTAAMNWFSALGTFGCDGVMAKKIHEPYHAGDRDAMIKVKLLKTADCVVGGFRYGSVAKGKTDRASLDSSKSSEIGSLLLGLYDGEGILHFAGHTSSFSRQARVELKQKVEPLKGRGGFSGRAPGGPSRWSTRLSDQWEPLEPILVCEVQYDHFSQGRFRHGTRFLRWRPEKDPGSCTFEQVEGKPTSTVKNGLFNQ